MKILLVTHQYIDIRLHECWCDSALYSTIQNMLTLGELYVVANKVTDYKASALFINQKMNYLPESHVRHLEPIYQDIKQYFQNKCYNNRIIEEAVRGMDLIIGYAPSDEATYAQKIASKKNIPFLTFLVACPWDALHNHHRLLARLMAPISFLETKHLVMHSDYVHYVTREFLQHRYPTKGKALGCSDVNITIPDARILVDKLQQYENKKKGRIKLVTIAHLDVRYKGQEYVIKAIKRLRTLYNDTRYEYYLIGAGTGGRLKSLCKKLEVETQIHMLGCKTREELLDILDSCDIYIQPSLQEGLPRAVVEAMSRALPCIGFHTGGIPELLEEQYVVKRKDVKGLVATLRILENDAEYRRVAERNFTEAQTYEHQRLQKRIKDFFTEIREDIKQRT